MMTEQITQTIKTKFGPLELDDTGGFLEGRWRFIDLYRHLEKEVGSFTILCETVGDHVPCSFASGDWPRLSEVLTPKRPQQQVKSETLER